MAITHDESFINALSRLHGADIQKPREWREHKESGMPSRQILSVLESIKASSRELNHGMFNTPPYTKDRIKTIADILARPSVLRKRDDAHAKIRNNIIN